MLSTIERAMKFLLRLYSSASAKGVIASGIAASIIEAERFSGLRPIARIPRNIKAGSASKVVAEKARAGSHFLIWSSFDFPMKSPITSSTTGVTEAAIMSIDWPITSGIGICSLPKSIPATTAIRSGFLMSLRKISLVRSFLHLIREHSR